MSWRNASRLEKLLLVAFAAQAAFMALHLVLPVEGTVQGPAWMPDWARTVAVALSFATSAGLAVAAVVLILKGRSAGALCCVVFYAMQVLKLEFANGAVWKFTFFPTVLVHLGQKRADDTYLVGVNLLALVLLFVSVAAWRRHPDLHGSPARELADSAR